MDVWLDFPFVDQTVRKKKAFILKNEQMIQKGVLARICEKIRVGLYPKLQCYYYVKHDKGKFGLHSQRIKTISKVYWWALKTIQQKS